MSISLGSNIASLQAQRQLFETEQKLSTVFERLSSGQRINRASDDAAGLAIASSLNTDTRVYTQGIRNFNDGLSFLQIADSTIESLSSVTIRIRELATQAATGSLSNTQRESIDSEAQALSEEYFRIAQSAEFNGQKIFDGSFDDGLRLQGGYGVDGGIFSSLGGALGDGTFTEGTSVSTAASAADVHTGDFNGDGILDAIVGSGGTGRSLNILIGAGDGTFSENICISTGIEITDVEVGDIDNDGVLDVVANSLVFGEVHAFLGNGDGTFGRSQSFDVGQAGEIDIGDFNSDGNLDLVTHTAFNFPVLVLGNGDGTFQETTMNIFAGFSNDGTLADFDGDGNLDIISRNLAGGTFGVAFGNGDGTFEAVLSSSVPSGITNIEAKDINGDGAADLAFTANGTNTVDIYLGGSRTLSETASYGVGSTPSDVAIADFNGDGFQDLAVTDEGGTVHLLEGNGTGQFESAVQIASGLSSSDSIAYGDFNQDGVYDLVTADNDASGGLRYLEQNTIDGISPLLEFSLATRTDALQALGPIEAALNRLTEQRGIVGAFQSRLASGINTLTSTSENYSAAESRIIDADIAFESSQLTRLNILQQSAAAVLGQANLQPSLALQLLG